MRKKHYFYTLIMAFIGIWLILRFAMYGFNLNIFRYQDRMWHPMMPMGLFTMVGLWSFVIFIVWYLTASSKNDESSSSSKLRERLAQGEITIEEYKRILKTLREEDHE